MSKVYSKNKGYSGVTANTVFVNGEATIDDNDEWLHNWFAENGYEVVKTEKKKTPEKTKEE